MILKHYYFYLFWNLLGCLRILVEYSKDRDVRLELPAKRALHNLDADSSGYILSSGIYQLHPDVRTDNSVIDYDVIFIHGILGGVFRTWRKQGDEPSKWKLMDVSSTLI